MISYAVVERKGLEILRDSLKNVAAATSNENVKKYIQEETIPLELVIMDQFWEEMQRDVYDLYDGKIFDFEF